MDEQSTGPVRAADKDDDGRHRGNRRVRNPRKSGSWDLSAPRPARNRIKSNRPQPDGVSFFLHANLGKPSVWVPNSAKTYVRRWQTSMLHGDTFPKVLSSAARADDFELWYFSVIRNHRCIFDDRPARHWYHMLGFGPPVEGFHVSDHYNMNEQLVAFKAS